MMVDGQNMLVVVDKDLEADIDIDSKEAAFFNKRTPEQLLLILSASDAPGKLCTNRQHLIQFLAADFHNVCASKAFVYICYETLRALLLSPHLRCAHPEDAVRAVARWVRYDSAVRKRFLDALVPILPHDEKHPLRNKAAIVSNWDVYHAAHNHSTRHHHNHNHHTHNNHNHNDPRDASTSTISADHNEEHPQNDHHVEQHQNGHHHHSPFHFHLHRPHLHLPHIPHLPHIHRPHLPHFKHRESKGKLPQIADLSAIKDDNIICNYTSPRTVLGDRMIEKRSSIKARDVEIHSRT